MNRPDEIADRASRLFVERRYAEALRLADEGLRWVPRDVACLIVRAWSLCRLDRPDEAVTEARRVCALAPESPAAWGVLGHVLLEGAREPGGVEEAERAFDRALEFSPPTPDLLNGRGCCRGLLGRHDGAIEDQAAAARFDPRNAAILANIAVNLRALGRLVEAEEIARRAVSIEPRSPYSQGTLRDILLDLGRYDEAAEVRRATIAASGPVRPVEGGGDAPRPDGGVDGAAPRPERIDPPRAGPGPNARAEAATAPALPSRPARPAGRSRPSVLAAVWLALILVRSVQAAVGLFEPARPVSAAPTVSSAAVRVRRPPPSLDEASRRAAFDLRLNRPVRPWNGRPLPQAVPAPPATVAAVEG